MKKIWAIAWRDYKAYFTSPIGFLVIAAFLGIMGWMFFSNLSHFNMMSVQYRQFNQGQNLSITDHIIRPVYGNMNVILLIIVPMLTMRLLAEERKMHTLELLICSPIRLWEIVFGKFLSSFLMIFTMLGATLIYPAILFWTGNPEWGPIFTNFLGTLLMTSCYLSIGVFFSSMTENQIIAGVLTFAAGISFWIVNWASQAAGPVLGEILTYMSLIQHFNQFSQGVLSTTDVIYYLSFIGGGLFLSHRVLDSYRWRS